ncbi:hypothetical protein [Salegentibacter chungangensis]|uniref:Uncharacterized protein n=1 Tax=Salegentibacter chungangensis TaxID=1335724 RepID=A0ABW3NSE1_9FLAO
MKRLLSLVAILLFCIGGMAQERTFLIFEFMKVDNSQEADYYETEAFWEKIHKQRVADGSILGWDLWSLLPGGENQGYQYLTVTVFNDPLKMMQAGNGIMESAKKAYPDLSEEEIGNRMNSSAESRDLAVRLFLMVQDKTEDEFEMDLGTITTLDLMKATDGNNEAYEKAEADIFKPLHQKMVDEGAKGDWQLLKVLFPIGSEVYASHITANMFKGMEQYINSMSFDSGLTEADLNNMEKGLETRDMKWVYLARLDRKVR